MSYDHYAEVRGPVKILKNSLHPIDASTSSQPCQTFGIHPKMPYLKQLYDEKDVSFVAGIGVLTKPVTQKTYRRDTRTRLFAHNESEYFRFDYFSSFFMLSHYKLVSSYSDFFFILCFI